jgi:hypothetical protein
MLTLPLKLLFLVLKIPIKILTFPMTLTGMMVKFMFLMYALVVIGVIVGVVFLVTSL